MSVFGTYSRYYDLLYRDKDYAGEANYVDGLIQGHRPGSCDVLDLGCGTGRHALLLDGMGYALTGVDRSEEMLATAKAQPRHPRADGSKQGPPVFVEGDVRTVRLGRTFDVVLSLFHVMSYQTTNLDLKAALTTIREHLKPGGLFIFDCWYGPAVLSDRPQVRVRRLEDEHTSVTRLAEPVVHANRNLVDVNYHVFIKDKQSGRVDELRETHVMRYLFAPELELLLDASGLLLTEFGEFMGARKAGFDTWNAVFIGTKAS